MQSAMSSLDGAIKTFETLIIDSLNYPHNFQHSEWILTGKVGEGKCTNIVLVIKRE